MSLCFIVDNEWVVGDEAELFFQLDEDEELVSISSEMTLPEILVEHGFFPSRSQARKAGWPVEIPEGFSDWFIGKKKRRLTILKPTIANVFRVIQVEG